MTSTDATGKSVWVDSEGDLWLEEPPEHYAPSTEYVLAPAPEPDPLEGLGESAYVAHPTDDGWNPYVKRYGEWWVVETSTLYKVGEDEVRGMIRVHGFKVLFEGVPA